MSESNFWHNIWFKHQNILRLMGVHYTPLHGDLCGKGFACGRVQSVTKYLRLAIHFM